MVASVLVVVFILFQVETSIRKKDDELGGGQRHCPSLTANLLKDRIVGDLVKVSSLNLNSETVQDLAETFLAGGVQHLGLDPGTIGRPTIVIE